MSQTKIKNQLPKVDCEAVTVFRSSDFTYESVRLVIRDSRVIAIEPLTRAPDMSQVAIGKAQSYLWKSVTRQHKNEVLNVQVSADNGQSENDSQETAS